MDNLNEEIDLVLAESLLEQSLRGAEDLRQADWEEFQDLLSRGAVSYTHQTLTTTPYV